MSTPRGARWQVSTVSLAVGGVAFVAAYIVILFLVMDTSTWDTAGGMLVGPALFLVTLPALARQARREGNSKIFWFLVIALAVKMLASGFRYYHAFVVVEKADARQFDQHATEIALRFLDGDFSTGLGNLQESNFIRFFTALIYTALHPSALAAFLIYAWLAFWGTYFFYRAFVLAVPDGDRRSYARWLFFLPSILFWPSSIGKESWMMFGLGIAAFGAAKAVRERLIPGLLVGAIGLGLAALVRAPIAVAMGMGLVVAGVLRRPNRGLRQLSPLAKLVSVALFAVVALALAATMNRYLVRSGFEGDVNEALTSSQEQTSQGGSEFTPTPITSPAGLVTATITILFRPFLNEAHTPEAVGTALEASVLVLVSVLRWRSFLAAVRSIRRVPYMAFALVYVAGSIYGLSAVANFGIIARQRTLLFPLYLALMCFLPRRRRRREHAGALRLEERAHGVDRAATVGAKA